MKAFNQYRHEVDLHGLRHKDVEDRVWRELLYAQDYDCFPVKFVTGNSKKMKQIVLDTVGGAGYITLHQIFPTAGFVLVQE